MLEAAERWRRALVAWALPEGLLAAAEESPYAPPAGVERPRGADDPTLRAVLAHLPADGVVLDVGCGSGGAWAGLLDGVGRVGGAEPVGSGARVVGVEPRPESAAAARAAGLEVVEGRWPEAAERVPVADAALCAHVLYDVAEAAPFVEALAERCRGVVVVEVTAEHPWAPLGPLFRELHGVALPDGPVADDLAEVVMDVVGAPVAVERWRQAGPIYPSKGALLAHRRRQLCLPPGEEARVAELLDEATWDELDDGRVRAPGREVVTLRWAGRAG